MKSSGWFLGIDLGTGSCKSVIVDAGARVLGFHATGYSGSDVREQRADDLQTAVVASVRGAMADAGVAGSDCAGLSLGGPLHGIMAVDCHGDPLTGVMTWADGRAVAQSDRVKASPDSAAELYRAGGCPVHPMYPLYKIMWLREERPEVFRKASRFLSAKEFILHQLTGEYLVDYCLAAGSGLLELRGKRWNPPALELAGIGEDRLSTLCSPLAVHHGLNPAFARETGLPEDVPVAAGSSDAANSSLGAGAVPPGHAACMLGTSGALRVLSPKPVLDPRARTWCYAVDENRWLVGGAINNGGGALSWFTDLLNQGYAHLPKEDLLSVEDVLHLAERAGPGAGGLICLPYLAGERSPNWNANARAAFFGMTLDHGAMHLARSLVESIAFRLRNIGEVLEETGSPVSRVIASGGFVKSPFWLQVVSDVFNREIVVPAWGESSSLGTAFWAILAMDKSQTLEGLAAAVTMERSHTPDAERAALYDELSSLYAKLYESVKPCFNEVAKMQERLGVKAGTL